MGDLNLDLLDLSNQYVNDYKDIMFEYSMFSLINRPTRITNTSATCIDHIWTNIYQNDYKSLILCDLIADHLPTMVVSSWGYTVTDNPTNKTKLREKELLTMKTLLENENFDGIANLDMNVYLEKLMQKIDNVISNIIESRVNDSSSKKTPNNWYDRTLTRLKNKKERLYKTYLGN